MPTDCISYQKSGYFTKLMIDYLDEKLELKELYNRFPNLENLGFGILVNQLKEYFRLSLLAVRHTQASIFLLNPDYHDEKVK